MMVVDSLVDLRRPHAVTDRQAHTQTDTHTLTHRHTHTEKLTETARLTHTHAYTSTHTDRHTSGGDATKLLHHPFFPILLPRRFLPGRFTRHYIAGIVRALTR